LKPRRLVFRLFLLSWLSLSTVQAQSIERIISLAPSLTELVYSAGAGDKLVGVVDYSDFPAEAKKLPSVGRFDALNLEQIILLQPDWILAWRSAHRDADLQRLRQMGFKVTVYDTQNLNEIPQTIKDIGQQAGRLFEAKAEANRLVEKLNRLQTLYHHRQAVQVFYQVWHPPLITVNGQQFFSQALKLCGANNVFADLPALSPQISPESVIKMNPDLIILGGQAMHQQAWLDYWRATPHLKAIENNHVILLQTDAYQRPTARLIDALPSLCQRIDAIRLKSQPK